MDMESSSSAEEITDLRDEDVLLEVEKLLAETKQVKEEQEKNLLQMELLELKKETLTKEKEKLELEIKGQNVNFLDEGIAGHPLPHGQSTSLAPLATNESDRPK